MQDVIILKEKSLNSWNISPKGANFLMNRFFIDEDAAFELSGVYDLKESSWKIDEEKGTAHLSLKHSVLVYFEEIICLNSVFMSVFERAL